MGDLVPTPGQTVGPFFGYALPYDRDSELVPPSHPHAIQLHGHVLDGRGQPVPDALLEIWQPDGGGTVAEAAGSLRRDGSTFTGWGRASTDDAGHYRFLTLEPGPTQLGMAPFIAMVIFARGLMNRLFTRAYVPAANGEPPNDRLLAALDPDRRRTLIADREDRGLRFDVRLQGEAETVFLAYPGS